MTSDAIIGPAVNRTSPMSHGAMKTNPQNASRTDGRLSGPKGRTRADGVVRALADWLMAGSVLPRIGWEVAFGRVASRAALGSRPGGRRRGRLGAGRRVEDALEGGLQLVEGGVDVHSGSGPIAVLELLPGGLRLRVVGDPCLVVRDIRVGEHRLGNVPIQLHVGVLLVDGVEERLLEGRIGREGAICREQVTRPSERGKRIERLVRMLAALQKTEGVRVELRGD